MSTRQTILPLASSAFSRFVDENLVLCFSHCDPQSLGRLARVCSVFKRISEDNTLWKALYEKRWGIVKRDCNSFPNKWKNYYRRADAANPTLLSVEKSWKLGLPLVAIEGIPTSGWIPAYRALMKMPFLIQPAKGNELRTALAQLLDFFETDKERAFSIYLTQRQNFIKSYPVLGAWLSKLFQTFRTEKLSREQMIFFPNSTKDPETPCNFLRGASLAWLDRGKVSEALLTCQCLNMLRQRIATNETQNDINDHYELIREGVYRNPAVRPLEILGDRFSELSGFEDLAIETYVKALKIEISLPPSTQLLIAAKLSQVLIKKRNGKYSPDILCLPLKCFASFVTHSKNYIDLVPLTSLIILATSFGLTEFYELLLKETRSPHYECRLCPDSVNYYFFLFRLCLLAGKPRDAVFVWEMLCHSLSRNYDEADYSNIRLNLYKMIYVLLNNSPEACDVLLSLNTTSRMTQVGQAYAHHCKGETEIALKQMIHLTPFVYSTDIEWVDELSNESFEALLIYSLSLHEEKEIDTYFSDKMDELTDLDGLLCFNMAVRLYFEGFTQSALEGIASARAYGFNEPELFVLQGLCFKAYSEVQQAALAFNRAQALNQSYTSNRTYQELDLLIFYKEAT